MSKRKRVIKRSNPRDIYQVTKCDKCGSRLIYFKTRDNSHIMCISCALEMGKLFDQIGYRPIWGYYGYIKKLPKAMIVWSVGYEDKINLILQWR